MDISFSPALGETRSVAVAPDADSVYLQFIATFSNVDYSHVINEGIQVELWTNLPSADHPGGTWNSWAFTQISESYPKENGLGLADILGKSQTPFLVSEDEDVRASSGDNNSGLRLCLNLKVAVADVIFSGSAAFTYRLVHSSGSIQWLGRFKEDGRVQFKRQDSRITYITEDWGMKDRALVWAREGPYTEKSVPILSVNSNLAWTVWAIGEQSFPRSYALGEECKDACVLYFIPKYSLMSFVTLQPFCLAIEPRSDFALHLTGDGVVSVHREGPSQTGIQLLDIAPPNLRLISNISQMLSGPRADLPPHPAGFQIYNDLANSAYFLIVRLPARETDVAVLTFIPLAITENKAFVLECPIGKLSALAPAPDFVIYSRSTSHNLWISSQNTALQSLIFSLTAMGGQLTLSPVDVLAAYENSPSCQVSLLVPHKRQIPDTEHLSGQNVAVPVGDGTLGHPVGNGTLGHPGRAIVNNLVNERLKPGSCTRAGTSWWNVVLTYLHYVLAMITHAFRTISKAVYRPRHGSDNISLPQIVSAPSQDPISSLEKNTRIAGLSGIRQYEGDRIDATTASEDSKGLPNPALVYDVLSQDVAVLVRHSQKEGSESVQSVRITLDGDAVDSCTRELQSGTHLITFTIPKTGQIKITLP